MMGAKSSRPAGTVLVLAVSVAALAAPAAASAEATITVEPTAGKNTFAPTRVVRNLGGAQFTWVWGPDGGGSQGFHDVVSDGQLFDSGEAVTQGTFAVNASAGSYRYFCSIHFGMDARIAVRPEAQEAAPGRFRVSWATKASQTGRRYDVRFKVAGGTWRTWLQDTRRRSGVFNTADGTGASASAKRRILIQVRSENTKRKASDWSPALRVTP